MKRLILFSITSFMLCFFCGCSKDSEESTPEEPSYAEQLIGTWKYVHRNTPPYSHEIYTDSKLTILRNGTFTFKGETMTPWLDHDPDNILATAKIDISGTYTFNEEKHELMMIRPTWDNNGTESTYHLYFKVYIYNGEMTLDGNSSGYSDWDWKFVKQ